MGLKFHMQHDQTSGLQNDKNQPGRESKMATDAKNSKTNKVYLAEILYEAHTCDKFQRGIREVFLSFPGGF